MTHRTAETSWDTLQRLKESGQDVTDRERCKLIIEEYGPITMEQMEMHMGKTKSAFSGRIRELKDNDTVEVVGRSDGHQLLEVVDDDGRYSAEETSSDDEALDDLNPQCTECGRQYHLLEAAMACCEEVSDDNTQNQEKVCNDSKQKPEPGDTIWG